MRLQDKVAVVTGGTSGIGRSIVELFRREGATVVFSGRRSDLGHEIEQTTGATFVQADVAIEADAERTVRTAVERGGRLDILINNAGMAPRQSRLERTSLETFDQVMAVHVRGPLAHMKYAVAVMRPQKSGSIINMASVGGHRAGFGSLSYSAAKAALIHLSRVAAVELGEDNIRCNSISPGGIATGIFGKAMGMQSADAEASVGKVAEGLPSFQPIPRAGVGEDVAEAALYLASDASSFVSGIDMVVDGALIGGRRPAEVAATGATLKALLG
jgi:NAD(P)-dependent dehydrogenase (short-subunit alcohol dehydrogenase family)